MLSKIVEKIRREIRFRTNLRRAKELGIDFSRPNYLYKNRLNSKSTVIDAGCADDPDLSLFMMKSFGVKAFAIDPTRKHAPALAVIQGGAGGRFVHFPLAVANESGTLQFYESVQNDSGSLVTSHGNITQDDVRTYDVEALTIPDLCQRIGVASVDYLKLDLEGIEYKLIEGAQASDFENVDQLFVEFHHHCIPEYSSADTSRLAHRVAGFGFEMFTLDDRNYLFYRAH